MLSPTASSTRTTLSSYNVLDVSDFKHYRINHCKRFGKEKNHINGIETSGTRPSVTCAASTASQQPTSRSSSRNASGDSILHKQNNNKPN